MWVDKDESGAEVQDLRPSVPRSFKLFKLKGWRAQSANDKLPGRAVEQMSGHTQGEKIKDKQIPVGSLNY